MTDESGPPELETEPVDFRARRLCSDGNCVGVIGADGRCGECGAAGSTEPMATDDALADEPSGDAPAVPSSGTHADEPTSDAPGEAHGAPAATDGSADEAGSDEPAAISQRALCSDGACVGVIGDDGKCTVCGLPALPA